ncbi:hypothetical protein CLAVI_001010 [Candidatus Clavichlamydia salmonicola]|uniref:hypothetical protein n=1 Tax=Candidatus Clavichlamydia salmonicola TaxID=469812 RepID=UPI0018914FCE|nr:hypothetical protein [Candidatus Clavichlamydia salmonicola]MBF5051367.1 hypothetical protein [Candidatus Clavichlamydia salmonicola]
MSGIGDGFSSGIQSLNNNILVYAGRRCPSSWRELKDNVTNNVRTCAKLCSAFLDSSLGLAVSMGVLGFTTASVCMQEDLLEVVATTLLPLTTSSTYTTLYKVVTTAPVDEDKVGLCFHPKDYFTAYNITTTPSWKFGKVGKGKNATDLSRDALGEPYQIFCVQVEEYQSHQPSLEIPRCSGLKGQGTGLLGYVFMFWLEGIWQLSLSTECVTEKVFKKMIPTSQQSSIKAQAEVTTSIVKQKDASGNNLEIHPYCFSKKYNMSMTYPDYFINTTNCIVPHHLEKVFSSTSFILESAGKNDNCSPCNMMLLAFGVGSVITLMATLGKIIYKQCTFQGLKKPKGGSRKCRRLADLILEEGLLLGASGLGTGVLVTSLLPPCGPVDESAKKIVMASTAIY